MLEKMNDNVMMTPASIDNVKTVLMTQKEEQTKLINDEFQH
jgi:hypothetical protein